MTWVDLGNPRPRPGVLRYDPVRWPDGDQIALSSPAEMPLHHPAFERTIVDLSSRRRSARNFAPLAQDQLGWLLGLVNRQLASGPENLGFPLTLRPAPSAGAIHPIHLIVQSPALSGWHRYDPTVHALMSVPCELDVVAVRRHMDELVEAPTATLLLLAAEPGKTASKYVDSCSLVWRDAGVLLGYLSLAAEALGLAFVPLGITADPWVSGLVNEAGLAGVGAALVGTRV